MKTEKSFYINPLASNKKEALTIDDFTTEKPEVIFDLPFLGVLRTKTTDEIESSNWALGCETLDRDYADYDQYKDYLRPLGIKLLCFQGGWAKTEKKAGEYSWQWMDHIVEDAVKKGLKPWIQTGYGNTIYPGAGGENLGAGMPLSKEGNAAYERWVAAMVTRYRDVVFDWEVWNEPNFGDNAVNTPEITAEFNLRTGRIIKEIQPEARISALALGHINLEFVERFFKYIAGHNGCGLFHDVTYHDYVYNPDSNKLAVYKMRQIVEKYAPGLIMRQGENGAPSVQYAGGALADHSWSEFSQAKWDTRRMLENLGNDIESSVFSIAEMQYTGNGPISKKNTKGLLETRPDNTVVRPKTAYYAVQHVTAVFDHTLERITDMNYLHNLKAGHANEYWYNSDRSVSVYGYRQKETGDRVYTVWKDDAIPGEECQAQYLDFAFRNSRFTHPVVVDIITGNVYDIPKEQWEKEEHADRLRKLPVYDGPVLIAEKSLIQIR